MSTYLLRARRPAVLLIAATLLLSSCNLSLQSLPKIGAMTGPGYTITADFSNVVNLPADAQVRIGSSQVGQVSSIGLEDFTAVVKMRIKKSVRLPVGTTASIAFDTPLGDDYVILQLPKTAATAYLGDGSTLGQIGRPAPSVEDTFAALGALLNGGGINQLQTIISQSDLALDGNTQQIRSLIEDTNATISSLAGNAPAIDRALSAMATLSTTLHQGQSSITTGLAALGPAVAQLADQSDNLDQLFADLNQLSSAANAVINASLTGSIETFQQLGPLLDQLTEVQGQLQKALPAIQALETYTPRAIPGDYLQLSIAATIDIPPVPSDAPPLQKITVDPPDPQESYAQDPSEASVALLVGWGLP